MVTLYETGDGRLLLHRTGDTGVYEVAEDAIVTFGDLGPTLETLGTLPGQPPLPLSVLEALGAWAIATYDARRGIRRVLQLDGSPWAGAAGREFLADDE